MFDNIKNIFSDLDVYGKSITGFGINDILDMLIAAYIIYNVVIWVKETRAWSLLKGFLVILIISVASVTFNLYTVNWIIEKTFNVGLLALIVIFQPELRKALDQIGRGKIVTALTFNNQSNDSLSQKSIDELVNVIFHMAEEKTGALIAIEQSVPLTEFEVNGVKLNANITFELLANIFYNKAPLHDGAVIIKHDLISCASAILPLTQVDVDKELGTRHRAAIGLSEVSDAIIIVVSEETGYVSVATGSILHRNVTEDELMEILKAKDEIMKKGFWKGHGSDV